MYADEQIEYGEYCEQRGKIYQVVPFTSCSRCDCYNRLENRCTGLCCRYDESIKEIAFIYVGESHKLPDIPVKYTKMQLENMEIGESKYLFKK